MGKLLVNPYGGGTACICGATRFEDHTKDCPTLASMQAESYPAVLDDNGRPWYVNQITELEKQLADTMRENERLLNAYKYGHQCLINVGFPNLAELMAVTAGRHNRT